jgi:integrase
VTDRVEELLETFIVQHVSQNRSAREISRLLRREVGKAWGHKSIHEISKRDVVEVVSAIEQRGAPVAANKTLKVIKTFLRWCVGRAVLDQSPTDGVPLPAKEVARDRVLSDPELAQIILAARKMGGPYGGIVEFLALTGQRREEVARSIWDEFNLGQRIWTLPKARTKAGLQVMLVAGARNRLNLLNLLLSATDLKPRIGTKNASSEGCG